MTKTTERKDAAIEHEMHVQRIAEAVLPRCVEPERLRAGYTPMHGLEGAFKLAEAFIESCERRIQAIEKGGAE